MKVLILIAIIITLVAVVKIILVAAKPTTQKVGNRIMRSVGATILSTEYAGDALYIASPQFKISSRIYSICNSFTHELTTLIDRKLPSDRMTIKEAYKSNRYNYKAISNVLIGNILGFVYCVDSPQKVAIEKEWIYKYISSLSLPNSQKSVIKFCFNNYIDGFAKNNVASSSTSSEWNLFLLLLTNGGTAVKANGKVISLIDMNGNQESIIIKVNRVPGMIKQTMIDISLTSLIQEWTNAYNSPIEFQIANGYNFTHPITDISKALSVQ